MNAEALSGKVLGTCTLQQLIGRGGMGAVFLAQQSRPRRQVAVKVLLPIAAQLPGQRAAFLERFRRETDAAASLEHPNIMPVHEYGEQDGLAYLVMPYISGGTLRDELEREGQLPLTKIVYYLDQMATALDIAHEHGVIHRDVKPANILMTHEGRLLLTDFGLVKIVTKGQDAKARLSDSGMPMGTPDYMAPEQVTGDRVDMRADVYSLGVILYQMVTGTTPFKGEMPLQVALQHVHVPPPPPRGARQELPTAAEQVILRVLAKNPADRYMRATDLASAFRLTLEASGIQLSDSPTMGIPVLSQPVEETLFAPRSHGLFAPRWRNSSSPIPDNWPESEAGLNRLPITPQAERQSVSEMQTSKPSQEQAIPALAPLSYGDQKDEMSPTTMTDDRHSPTKPAHNNLLSSHRLLRLGENKPNLSAQTRGYTPEPPIPQSPSGATFQVRPAPTSFTKQAGPVSLFSFADPAQPVDTTEKVALTQANAVGDNNRYTGDAAQPGAGQTLASASSSPHSQSRRSTLETQQNFAPVSTPNRIAEPAINEGKTGTLSGATSQLMVPTGVPNEQGMTSTMKLVQPVKVVKVPVAGQPGRYLTGLLPMPAAEPQPAPTTHIKNDMAPQDRLKKRMRLVALLIAIAVIVLSSELFLFARSQSQQTANNRPQPIAAPNLGATATIQASATAQANIILSDSLVENMHDWPIATIGSETFTFKDGTYHIRTNDLHPAIALLPDNTLPGSLTYTLTMQEINGDDNSINNLFGMILHYNTHQRNGKTYTSFYCFEIVHTQNEGRYEFRKYDDSFGPGVYPWTVLWSQPMGKEYHFGHGTADKNTVTIVANGATFSFTVNAKQFGSAQDNTLQNGQIGMLVSLRGSEVAFSNLLLTYR